MKGFGAIEKGRTGWLEKPDPVITAPDQVLIETTGVAMCTSDVHMVEAGNFPSIFGNIIGHEAVGRVIETGSGVKDFKVGDRVAIHDQSPVWGDRMAQLGVIGFAPGGRTVTPWLDGMFSEKILFERADSGLAHIPDNVSDEQALMALDMVATSVTGIEFLDISFGESVAVIGIGPVGLCAVELCAIRGAGKIIGVGHRTACKEAAYKMGASDVLDYTEGSVLDLILGANGGKPVDKVLICGYYEGVLADAFRMVRVGGSIANVAMMMKPMEVIPTFGCGDRAYRAFRTKSGRFFLENIMNLISYGRIHPENVISHTYHGFENIPQAFEKMSHKTDDLIKTVCIF